MTPFDNCLINLAQKIKYWNYRDVYKLADYADTEECTDRLKNIASILYDHSCNGV